MKRGEIVGIGRHRLMCGDASSSEDVNHLFGDSLPDMIFTSPPYPKRRVYGEGENGREDWANLVVSATNVPVGKAAQVLVNLGICHEQGEWIPYWHEWLNRMRMFGWKRFGLYCWDQMCGIPGSWNGRLAPSFELIFHLNKISKQPNNIVACKNAGKILRGTGQTRHDGKQRKGTFTGGGAIIPSHRKSDSVIRITRRKHRRDYLSHNAQFPPELADWMMRSYSQKGDIVYDPFGGVGSSMVAAELNGRRSFCMEIEPTYCDQIVWRMQKMFVR